MKFLPEILEMLGMFGVIGLLPYLSTAKVVLGAAMTAVGAFFPRFRKEETEHGAGSITIGQVKAAVAGSCRFVVVFGGIIIIIGSFGDAHVKWEAAQDRSQKINSEDFPAALPSQEKPNMSFLTLSAQSDLAFHKLSPEAREKLVPIIKKMQLEESLKVQNLLLTNFPAGQPVNTSGATNAAADAAPK